MEGLSEATLKQRVKKDKALCCRYKKRHRKDLTADEVEAIVAATKEPYRLHKDIAQQFHVSAILVGRLAKEAARKPGMVETWRNEDQYEERKKLAIEEAATDMLAANVPISDPS